MTAGVPELTTSLTTATTSAPAKINLLLDVLGPRRDGYHELRSLVVGVGLYDHLRAAIGPQPGFEVDCNNPALRGDANLAARACRLFAERAGIHTGLRLHVEKRVPVAAGLGGGSSDAAATLRLLDELHGTGIRCQDLAALGAEIGSDVPLFFHLPCAVMGGRGEQVERVTVQWTGWVLLVWTGLTVSTPNVYPEWRPSDSQRQSDAASWIDQLVMLRSAEDLTALLRNELEPAVFRVCPQMKEISKTLNTTPWGPFRISGAGSTFFRLFDDRDAALHAARQIHKQRPNVRCMVAAAPVNVGNIRHEEH